MVTVISVGPGDESYLTIRARAAIDGARTIFAAQRHAHLLMDKPHESLEPLAAAVDAMAGYHARGEDISVLVSGDAGVYSLLPILKRRFPIDDIAVVPGVSALQLLCAEAKVMWQHAKILSLHGRDVSPAALCYWVRANGAVILFCDRHRGAGYAAASLIEGQLGAVEMIIGARLGYSDQLISRGAPADFVKAQHDPLAMIMVINENSSATLPPIGMPDEAFERGNVPMTKMEIRQQAVCALQLPIDAVVWDIGAGTGSISIECARQCPLGQVYAIERNGEGIQLIAQNAAMHGVGHLQKVAGRAPDALRELPIPTHVFIGGSGGELPDILDLLEAMDAPLRLVATAVTMETAHILMARLSQWQDFRMAQVAVSRMEKVGSVHMLRAQNPVFIAEANWRGTK